MSTFILAWLRLLKSLRIFSLSVFGPIHINTICNEFVIFYLNYLLFRYYLHAKIMQTLLVLLRGRGRIRKYKQEEI